MKVVQSVTPSNTVGDTRDYFNISIIQLKH